VSGFPRYTKAHFCKSPPPEIQLTPMFIHQADISQTGIDDESRSRRAHLHTTKRQMVKSALSEGKKNRLARFYSASRHCVDAASTVNQYPVRAHLYTNSFLTGITSLRGLSPYPFCIGTPSRILGSAMPPIRAATHVVFISLPLHLSPLLRELSVFFVRVFLVFLLLPNPLAT